MLDTDLIAAIATPAGRGGIGIVRLSGPDVSHVVAGIVRRSLKPRVATLTPFHGADGEALDHGLALLFPAPHSYTGETVLELHGHGGPAVLALVLKRCVELGARLAMPGEFTKRAFLNDKMDLAQAEAVADLIEAATATAARAATRSLAGEFSREVNAIVEALIELRTLIEATLDFPEEDIEFLAAADATGKLAVLRERVAAVFARAREGNLLREGLDVVIIGAPNVGKSSLLNRLVGDDVAIVTPIAGTTRDAVRSSIEIRGIPLHVIDTAGLREATDEVEKIGIERTWAAIDRADLALVITDTREQRRVGDDPVVAKLPPLLPRVLIHNKIDLSGEAPRVALRDAIRTIWISAKTGDGMGLLRDAILDVAGAHEDMEGTFLARARHLEALGKARARLAAAAEQLEGPSPPLELAAEELRNAQRALSDITGTFTSDDLLGEIFGRFCIGK